IRDQLNAEAEAVQIILTGIDNDIYSTDDACSNACEMWKAIERLKQGNPTNSTDKVFETYKNVTHEIRDQLNAKAEAIQIILTGIDNDIYSPVDACPNASESINVQDLETNLFWEFGKFTSLDGESFESYYSRFYKMMNELTRNQCKVTNHQVNVQFLLQLQPKWQRGKAIVNSPQQIYDQEPSMVDDDDDETSKEKEIDKLMALISLSNAGYESQRTGNVAGARETVGLSMVQKSGIQCYNFKEYGHVARECQKPKRAKDAAY
nr:retrovirus-related Pol polyprotein from transposon TNT 1-94 [Tanacetum cinerariifolium]